MFGYHPYPPPHRVRKGGGGTRCERAAHGTAPVPGIADFDLSDASVHSFAAVLQGVVMTVVGGSIPSPSPVTHTGKVLDLTLL